MLILHHLYFYKIFIYVFIYKYVNYLQNVQGFFPFNWKCSMKCNVLQNYRFRITEQHSRFFLYNLSSKLAGFSYCWSRLWSCLWKKQLAVLRGHRVLGMHSEECLSVYLQESSLKASCIWSVSVYLHLTDVKSVILVEIMQR